MEKYFRNLRFDEKFHLGGGDVRLSIGMQEELIAEYDSLLGALVDALNDDGSHADYCNTENGGDCDCWVAVATASVGETI